LFRGNFQTVSHELLIYDDDDDKAKLLVATLDRLPACGYPLTLYLCFYAHANWQPEDPRYYHVTTDHPRYHVTAQTLFLNATMSPLLLPCHRGGAASRLDHDLHVFLQHLERHLHLQHGASNIGIVCTHENESREHLESESVKTRTERRH